MRKAGTLNAPPARTPRKNSSQTAGIAVNVRVDHRANVIPAPAAIGATTARPNERATCPVSVYTGARGLAPDRRDADGERHDGGRQPDREPLLRRWRRWRQSPRRPCSLISIAILPIPGIAV